MATLSYTTASESHGQALIALVEGLPAGIIPNLVRIDHEMARRQDGCGRARSRLPECIGTKFSPNGGRPVEIVVETWAKLTAILPCKSASLIALNDTCEKIAHGREEPIQAYFLEAKEH